MSELKAITAYLVRGRHEESGSSFPEANDKINIRTAGSIFALRAAQILAMESIFAALRRDKLVFVEGVEVRLGFFDHVRHADLFK